MISLIVLFSITLSCKLTEAQFTPVVTIDCLAGNNPNDVEVDITSGASTSGKVSLYVGTTLCSEQLTTTTAITITFTETDCSGTYPAQETQFDIYVTEGANVQLGNPDKGYQVTCHTDDTETVTEMDTTTDATITDHVLLETDVVLTDTSDNPVTLLTIGTSYKMKIDCQAAFVAEYDIICKTVMANSLIGLIDNGCSQYPSFFPTFTHPSQCSLTTTFQAFAVTGSASPFFLDFDLEITPCIGACTQPATCTTEPAWGRKRRDTSSNELNVFHVHKEIWVYPENSSLTETSPTVSSQTQETTCIPTPIVYIVIMVMCVLIIIGLMVDIMLIFTFKRSRKTYSRLDSQRHSRSKESSASTSRFRK